MSHQGFLGPWVPKLYGRATGAGGPWSARSGGVGRFSGMEWEGAFLALGPQARAASSSRQRKPGTAGHGGCSVSLSVNRGLLLGGVLGVLLCGQAAEAARRSTGEARSAIGRRAVSRASLWVGLPSLSRLSREVNDDCSGLMHLAYWRPGLSLMPEAPRPGENGVAAIYRKAQELGGLRERPRAGDLVFFQETYDRNRDGRRNDGLTHIGVVERVSADGLVTFVHRAGGGVKRSRLHLYQRDVRRDGKGRVLNDWLRRADGKGSSQLAGELVVGFAAVDERWVTPEPARTARRAPVKR